MAGQFTPKNFLRQTSNVLLRAFFTSHDALCDFPWSDTLEHQVEPIFKTWQALPNRPLPRVCDAVRRENNSKLHAGEVKKWPLLLV